MLGVIVLYALLIKTDASQVDLMTDDKSSHEVRTWEFELDAVVILAVSFSVLKVFYPLEWHRTDELVIQALLAGLLKATFWTILSHVVGK